MINLVKRKSNNDFIVKTIEMNTYRVDTKCKKTIGKHKKPSKPIQWVINGCALNALTFKESHINEIIPHGHRRLQDEEIVKENDQIAHISGKLSWIKPEPNDIGKHSCLVGRIVIRKRTSWLSENNQNGKD